jgi:hypothetical protein
VERRRQRQMCIRDRFQRDARPRIRLSPGLQIQFEQSCFSIETNKYKKEGRFFS